MPITQTGAGVILPEPGAISASVKRQVKAAFADLPPGRNMAMLSINLESGVNFALGRKYPSGWEIEAYIGKNWKGPLSGGINVAKSWP